ncbi:hypothetical protein [Flavobacterium limi]|uniref:MORN repeat variant n=1 Tax=Flavobacterium limi TaxID=2045105 RepID=A0ABQ1UNU4_9FLAO|nr:hypothetical protein [Flavobacterium limi]GGF23517.1 hypothetical protein GCM10011518_36040 [Flavobacterium limi]
MREPVILDEDINLEHNLWGTNYLKYKGELFTGTLLYNDTNPFSYTEYKDGDYDGESVSYHKNGQLAETSIYSNGNYISGKEWYDNGQIKYDSIKKTKWDKDGIVAFENGCWFYKNGIIKEKYEESNSTIFNPNGEIAIITEYHSPCSKNIFYHKNLLSFYPEILIALYPELDSNSHNLKYKVFDWISQVYVKNSKLGERLLTELFVHPIADIQEFAKHLYSFTVRKKKGDNEKTYWMEYNENSKVVY